MRSIQWLKIPAVRKVSAFLITLYIHFVYYTTRWQRLHFHIPQAYIKQGKPFITCFWHNRLALLCFAWPSLGRPFHMLISAHRDGRLISDIMTLCQIKTVTGSTNRKGTQALRILIKILKKGGTVGLTPDGPRGPRECISDGILMLSQLTQADILPVSYHTSRHRRFSSWDRFILPLPFGRGCFAWGTPVPAVCNKAEYENKKKLLNHAMIQLTNLVETQCHKK